MFKPDEYMENRLAPSPMKGWRCLIVAPDDVRGQMDLNSSEQLAKRCKVEVVRGHPHTVLMLREGQITAMERAGGARGLKSCLARIFSERDLQRFFKGVCNHATITSEIKARRTMRQEMKPFMFLFKKNSTVRGSAEVSGKL